MIKIVNNGFNENVGERLNFTDNENYPHICNNCGELFCANIVDLRNEIGQPKAALNCPICGALYYVVYNEINDFVYLEFAKSWDYIIAGDFPLLRLVE